MAIPNYGRGLWIGVDPGLESTGLAVIAHGRAILLETIRSEPGPEARIAARIYGMVARLAAKIQEAEDGVIFDSAVSPVRILAVECSDHFVPRARSGAVIAQAMVAGGVLCWAAGAGYSVRRAQNSDWRGNKSEAAAHAELRLFYPEAFRDGPGNAHERDALGIAHALMTGKIDAANFRKDQARAGRTARRKFEAAALKRARRE